MTITLSGQERGDGYELPRRTVDTGPPTTSRPPRQISRGPTLPAEERDDFEAHAVLAALLLFLMQMLVFGIFLGTAVSVVAALSLAGAMRCCRATDISDTFPVEVDSGTTFCAGAEPSETAPQWKRGLKWRLYPPGILGVVFAVFLSVGNYMPGTTGQNMFFIEEYLFIAVVVAVMRVSSCWPRTRPSEIERVLLFQTCVASFVTTLSLLIVASILVVVLVVSKSVPLSTLLSLVSL